MALLESESVLLDAVAEGVKAGILGVKEDSNLYYGQNVTPQIDWIALRGEFAKKIKEEETAKEGKEDKGPVPFDEKMKKELMKKRNGMVKRVSIRAAIPWDKLSSVISGVIRPLKDKGQPPEIIVEIKANSEEGYDRTTLDIKVKETLQQIDARIEEWKEE
jgi:hypothetical protein